MLHLLLKACISKGLLTAGILTCHDRKSVSTVNIVRDGSDPFKYDCNDSFKYNYNDPFKYDCKLQIPYSNVCIQYFLRALAQPFTTFALTITFGQRISLNPREGKDISVIVGWCMVYAPLF